MTLTELQVRFTADAAPLAERLTAVKSMLTAAGEGADALVARFHAAGASAGDGLASGILSRQGAVIAAARAVADAAASALRAALSIHSPSKVTEKSGALFSEGFYQGISGGTGAVKSAAEGLRASAGNAAFKEIPVKSSPADAPALSENAVLDRISLTIPLNVDGYTLGVAAIDGINRVSRSTGNVELSL